jgi:hypothetical protein
MADSTRAMRRSIFERELLPVWRKRLLTEITPDDLEDLRRQFEIRFAVASVELFMKVLGVFHSKQPVRL